MSKRSQREDLRPITMRHLEKEGAKGLPQAYSKRNERKNERTGRKERKKRRKGGQGGRMNEYMNEKICENNMNINLRDVTNEKRLDSGSADVVRCVESGC